jgi:hypothetical protein
MYYDDISVVLMLNLFLFLQILGIESNSFDNNLVLALYVLW